MTHDTKILSGAKVGTFRPALAARVFARRTRPVNLYGSGFHLTNTCLSAAAQPSVAASFARALAGVLRRGPRPRYFPL